VLAEDGEDVSLVSSAEIEEVGRFGGDGLGRFALADQALSFAEEGGVLAHPPALAVGDDLIHVGDQLGCEHRYSVWGACTIHDARA